MSTPTHISAAAAAPDTSNITQLPDAVERRIAAVNAAADKIRFELGQAREHAWANGFERARGNHHSSQVAERQENTAAHSLGEALAQLVTIALHADEDGA
jgi:hypothetical protein